jgi:hypothetical protein
MYCEPLAPTASVIVGRAVATIVLSNAEMNDSKLSAANTFQKFHDGFQRGKSCISLNAVPFSSCVAEDLDEAMMGRSEGKGV